MAIFFLFLWQAVTATFVLFFGARNQYDTMTALLSFHIQIFFPFQTSNYCMISNPQLLLLLFLSPHHGNRAPPSPQTRTTPHPGRRVLLERRLSASYIGTEPGPGQLNDNREEHWGAGEEIRCFRPQWRARSDGTWGVIIGWESHVSNRGGCAILVVYYIICRACTLFSVKNFLGLCNLCYTCISQWIYWMPWNPYR